MYACMRCEKSSIIGIDSTHRYGGGWSMRGQRTRKVWKPNLHVVRIRKDGVVKSMRLCTKCIRIVKAQPAPKPVTVATPVA